MGNLMSDCQELVYHGFVPVPDDLEQLQSDPENLYSNTSRLVITYKIFKALNIYVMRPFQIFSKSPTR